MKIISLIISILIFTFASNIFAQTETAKPKLPSPKEAEVEMDKLQQFVGEFSSSSKLFSETTGEQINQDTGKIICRLRSLGYVFTIEKESIKQSGRKYDDLMAFQYDAVEHKMKAVLYSPDVKARQIDVEIKGNIMTLIYEPYFDSGVTRETINAKPDGSIRWLIEHKHADNTYKKIREINAVKQNYKLPENKTYLQLSAKEQSEFIAAKLAEVPLMKASNLQINDSAIRQIKFFVDKYAKRVNTKKLSRCGFGDNLQSTFERAAKNAPLIISAFNQENIDAQIGLYLAMVESEHCVCAQSGTGPLGLFQMTKATAESSGLKVFKGASPSIPDERCDVKLASIASAKYLKSLMQKSTAELNKPIYAILAYGWTQVPQMPEDLSTIISDNEKLMSKYRTENFRYIPMFFAAAIVGENPQNFGLKINPLSSYADKR